MDRHPRYDIIDRIAAGDFATVYRGFDRELNREVAIKQIHPQFLADPSKLERYWQEAKLLASLEHPYIMTIYDIVRERGWLILELMQGSLHQKLEGQQIDLEDLRLTIIYMSHALGFLHKNGIVHGDVKPSNLLLDKNHRVKLGDFGIARRLAGDDGSVIKGTTKYMAPEVVSDQFGPVGHHSDLYSLGFASYELMCGEHFDSLFPGLHMFGRDPQIAWMMWHGARDRSVPDIDKVLEGVPPELTRVIQRLTKKDPADRYLNSEEVIFDLKAHSEGKDPDDLKQAEAEAEAEEVKKQKRKRLIAYGAVAASLLLSLLMAIPWGSAEPPEQVANYPRAGVIDTIDAERHLIIVSRTESGDMQGLELDPERDRIFLNDQRSDFASLAVGDIIEVEQVTTADNNTFYQVDAIRQAILDLTSEIVSIDVNNGMIDVNRITEDGEEVISLYIPIDLVINYNGREEWDGQATKVRHLKVGDMAYVKYREEEERREASELSVTRLVSLTGVLTEINRDSKQISMRLGDEDSARLRTLPLGDNCRVTLNGIEVLSSGQSVAVADLRAGDEVTVRHDDMIRTIQAQREILSNGIVTRIDYDPPLLVVELAEPKQITAFQLADDCMIGLTSDGSERPLSFIRIGDEVALEHDSPDFIDATARVVRVTPLPNMGVWGVAIGFEQFDDQRVSPVRNSAADAQHMVDEFRDFYRIPNQQIKHMVSPTKPGLRRELEEFLGGIPPNDQLVVYISSRAYVTSEGPPVIAMRELDMDQPEDSGVSLRELLELLEPVETRETMLLLDLCHPGSGRDIQQQTSVVEFAELSRESPIHPLSASITIVTSSDEDQVNRVDQSTGIGLFAKYAGQAFHGAADDDGDHFVNSDELMAYLDDAFRVTNEGSRVAQQPIRYLPDPTPIRILPEMRDTVISLLGYLGQSRFNREDVEIAFAQAQFIQDDQPDGLIAYGLVNLKHDRTAESRTIFEQVVGRFPDEVVPRICLAWQHFLSKETTEAVAQMRSLVDVSRQVRDEEEMRFILPMVRWVGQMQVYATEAAETRVPPVQFKELEDRVQELGGEYIEAYESGQEASRAKIAEIDDMLLNATTAQAEKLRRERERMVTYLRLDYALLSDYVRYRLDR